MECTTALSNKRDLNYRKEAQKHLIEFFLLYSKYDLKCLADILGVNSTMLSRVLRGEIYLAKDIATKLIKWIWVLISE